MNKKNSSTKKIISASLANWSGIGITLISQLILVPIFLTYWDTTTYGAWILLQTVYGLIFLGNLAHHDYLYHENLKLGLKQKVKINLILNSSLIFSLLITLIVFFIVYLQYKYNIFGNFLGLEKTFKETWELSLLLLAGTLFITKTFKGLVVGPLCVYGHYPLFSWLNVLESSVTIFIPIGFVIFGFNFFETVIVFIISQIIFYIFFYTLAIKLLKKENFSIVKPDLKLGFSQTLKSLWVFSRHLIDMFRQTGIRIIISPIVGLVNLAAFTTTRTVANVAQQGLLSITFPIMPELMKSINSKEDNKIETLVTLLWLFTSLILSPLLLILQYISPELFVIWTLGKIEFNPLLFSFLSMSLLIMAIAQPAVSIIRGNNLIKTQFYISFVAVFILLFFTYLLTESWGLEAVGFSLLISEIIVLILYLKIVKKWLYENDLKWPTKSFLISLINIILSSIGIILIALDILPLFSLIITLIIQIILSIVLFNQLPELGKVKVYNFIKKGKNMLEKNLKIIKRNKE